jgi:hypothetical protein
MVPATPLPSSSDSPAPLPERLLRPPHRGVMIGVWVGLGVLFVAPAGLFLWIALCPEQSVSGRVMGLVMAAAMLFVPGRMLWVAVRRRVRTGSWRISDEERLANRRKFAARPGSKLAWVSKHSKWLATFWVVLAGFWIWQSLRAPAGDHFAHAMAVVWVGIAGMNVWVELRGRRVRT